MLWEVCFSNFLSVQNFTHYAAIHSDYEQAGVRPLAFRKIEVESVCLQERLMLSHVLHYNPNSEPWLKKQHKNSWSASLQLPNGLAVCQTQPHPFYFFQDLCHTGTEHSQASRCSGSQETGKLLYHCTGLCPTPLTSIGLHNLSHETHLAAIPIFSYAWQTLNCWYLNLKKYMKNTIFLFKKSFSWVS